MITRHAEAQIGHQQRVALDVVAQDATGEPLQPRMLRRAPQDLLQTGTAGQAHQLGRRVVEPAHQGLVVALTVDQDHPPEQAVERRRGTEHALGRDALARHLQTHALLGHEFSGDGKARYSVDAASATAGQ